MPTSDTKTHLENILLYQKHEFDSKAKEFTGHVLYNSTKTGNTKSELYLSHQDRVTFLGNRISNCTLKIHPVYVNDSGKLGLRMISGTEKWMEDIQLSVSGKAQGGS